MCFVAAFSSVQQQTQPKSQPQLQKTHPANPNAPQTPPTDCSVHPAAAPQPASPGGAVGHRRGRRHPAAISKGDAGALPGVLVLHCQRVRWLEGGEAAWVGMVLLFGFGVCECGLVWVEGCWLKGVGRVSWAAHQFQCTHTPQPTPQAATRTPPIAPTHPRTPPLPRSYEGTGRSLSLKLIQQLREQAAKPTAGGTGAGGSGAGLGRTFREVTLSEPIR